MKLLKKLLAACMLFGLFTVNVLAEDPSLKINGELITGTTDRIGSEGWKYDKGTSTLTLNGFEGESIQSSAGLNIILEGENTLENDSTYTIRVNGDLNITSSIEKPGSLKCSKASYGILVDNDLTIENTTVTATCGNTGLYTYANMIIKDSTVTASGDVGDGLEANPDITIEDSTVIASGKNTGINARTILNIKNSDVTVTGEIFGLDASLSIAIDNSTVVADGGDTGLFSTYISIEDSDVTVNSKTAGKTGMYSFTDVIITDSTVTANGVEAGINAGESINIINSNVKGSAKGTDSKGLHAEENITITDSAVEASGNSEGLDAGANINIIDSKVQAKDSEVGLYAILNINITNSTVEADGKEVAILVETPYIKAGQKNEDGNGEINIKNAKIVEGGELTTLRYPDAPDTIWKIIGSLNEDAKHVKIVPESTPDPKPDPKPEPTPDPAPKPVGRTCQDDGYPAGYQWSDAAQACVLVAPAGTSSTGRFAVVNTADK